MALLAKYRFLSKHNMIIEVSINVFLIACLRLHHVSCHSATQCLRAFHIATVMLLLYVQSPTIAAQHFLALVSDDAPAAYGQSEKVQKSVG